MTIAVNRNLSNCENSPEKKDFRGFNGIRTRCLCVRAAVLYQLSTYMKHIWSHIHFICIPAFHIISFCLSFLSRVDELNKLAGLQCVGLHGSAGRAVQVRTQRPRVRIPLKPRRTFFGLFRHYLNCYSLRWSHIHFTCIPAFHSV